MPNVNLTTAEPDVRDLLFKQDRPRPIDRFIDFFGDTGSAGEHKSNRDPDADDLDR